VPIAPAAPDISDTITRALEAKGLSQADLSRLLDTTRSTVHAIVHGKRKPRLDTLTRIADVLDTSVSELLAGRWRRIRRTTKAA